MRCCGYRCCSYLYAVGYIDRTNTVSLVLDFTVYVIYQADYQRISIVDVMGRHCSDLTISAGIAGGCEYIVASEINLIAKN